MKRIIFGISVAVGVSACTSQKPNTGTAAKNPMTVTLSTENMEQGKMLFENNCGRCHDLPNVKSFNDEKWKSIVDWMAPKSKLTAQQADLVYLYVSNSN